MSPSFFSAHHASPWSSNASKDSNSKTQPSEGPGNNVKGPEAMSSENRQSFSAYPGSTPLPSMQGNGHHGRTSFSADTRDDIRVSSTTSSNSGWGPAPVNAPYGVIGSSINASSIQPRRPAEAQHTQQPSVNLKQASLLGGPNSRPISHGRDTASLIPPAPLSAPPFKTSFFPLFGPPGTRQGFIMPGDWTINSSGFLISENARRMNAMAAAEADKVELHRRASSERPGGPAAGCRMCAVFPRVMLFPCEHRVCSECGSRFMTASGGMYCSCGEVRSSSPFRPIDS